MAALNENMKKRKQETGRLGGASFMPIHRDEAEQLRWTGGNTVRYGGAGSGVGSYDGKGGINPKAVQKQQPAAPGVSQDPYQAQADALYQQLMQRGDFKYDLQGDMLYRQYADQYSQLGRQAMMDTMGTAAGLTGGYGNSYANTVGNQAYQQYLGQLNAMVPDFYDRAYQRWLDQGELLQQQYQLALSKAGASGGGAAKKGKKTGANAGYSPFAQFVGQYDPTMLQQYMTANSDMTVMDAAELFKLLTEDGKK